jgi:phytoene/squalene synthetase
MSLLRRKTPSRASFLEHANASRRCISSFSLFRVQASRGSNEQRQKDLDHVVQNVRLHDPSGYLPGRLLPNATMTQAYYAVRSFWVETGLRFGTTAQVPPHSTPEEHLEWWQEGIDRVFDSSLKQVDHPTLRLIQSLRQENDLPWEKERFDTLLQGRRDDLTVRQYETLDDLHQLAERSCSNLLSLVLESGHLTDSSNPDAHKAARLVGITHGLTIALRTSIPVMSITGKIIVPADLCQKYGVKSPRYLLSALGQGDAECVAALQKAVRDIVSSAQKHHEDARHLRSSIQAEGNGDQAVAVLLPGLVAQMFLERLEHADYQLTDRDLRNVGIVEQASSSWKLLSAYWNKNY